MKTTNPLCRLTTISVAFGMICSIAFPILLSGQQTAVQPIGLPEDWSHKHVVFSNPGSFREAATNGAFDRWNRIVSDPRFIMQQMKRSLVTKRHGAQASAEAEAMAALSAQSDSAFSASTRRRIHRDWAQSLGATGKVGAGMYPAKYTFNPISPPSCSDFVVFNTSRSGNANVATIIAFNNIYVPANGGSCTGGPTVNWAYNTGTASTALTSVVLSRDGSQLAFVQTASSVASLVILKWKSGEGTSATSPAAPTTNSTIASTYVTCRGGSTSCELRLPFSGSQNNTNSSPFYDYANDIVYVGDNNGTLHKFTGVFNGTPAEVVSSGANVWPAVVSSGNILSSPVLDLPTAKVFVASTNNNYTLHSVNTTTGSGSSGVTSSAQLAANGASPDSPLLDSSTGKVYAFVGSDSTDSGASAVYQFGTSSLASSNRASLGSNSRNSNDKLFAGTFDDAYYSGSGTSGFLYSCASRTNNQQAPRLDRIDMSATFNSAAVTQGPNLTSNNSADCSPVTEFKNGTHDYLFLSVNSNGNTTGCSGACVYSFDLSTVTFSTSGNATAGLTVSGGASGIVIDNANSVTGGAQVYFSNLSNGAPCASGQGCAVQASQSALQ